MVRPQFYIRSVLKKRRFFCMKWHHVACSMDIILSKNASEAGYTSTVYLISKVA